MDWRIERPSVRRVAEPAGSGSVVKPEMKGSTSNAAQSVLATRTQEPAIIEVADLNAEARWAKLIKFLLEEAPTQ